MIVGGTTVDPGVSYTLVMLNRCLIHLLVCLLACLSGCKSSTQTADRSWWSPLEVPEIEERFEYDASGRPIVEWVGGEYEIELSYSGYAERSDRRRVIELLEANNELLEEIEDD